MVFFLSRMFVICNQHKHLWFLVSISISKLLLTIKHPSRASDLVLSVKNAPKCCAYSKAIGFSRLLLNVLGETYSRVFFQNRRIGYLQKYFYTCGCKTISYYRKLSSDWISCWNPTRTVAAVTAIPHHCVPNAELIEPDVNVFNWKNCHPNKNAKYLCSGSWHKCCS